MEGGGRCRLAGLLAATPGAAGQTDLRTSDTSGCTVRSEPADAGWGGPDRGRSPSPSQERPDVCWASAGLGDASSPGVPPLARDGPATPTASPAPLLPLHLERKINPRVRKLPSFARTHPRQGSLSSTSFPRGVASPLTPLGGVGIPLSPGDAGKTPPHTPSRCSGARHGGRRWAALSSDSCPGCAGHRGRLVHFYRQRPREMPDPTPAPAPPSSRLPPPAARERSCATRPCAARRGETRGAPPALQSPGRPPELPLLSDCLDFSPALKKIFPVIQISGK